MMCAVLTVLLSDAFAVADRLLQFGKSRSLRFEQLDESVNDLPRIARIAGGAK